MVRGYAQKELVDQGGTVHTVSGHGQALISGGLLQHTTVHRLQTEDGYVSVPRATHHKQEHCIESLNTFITIHSQGDSPSSHYVLHL